MAESYGKHHLYLLPHWWAVFDSNKQKQHYFCFGNPGNTVHNLPVKLLCKSLHLFLLSGLFMVSCCYMNRVLKVWSQGQQHQYHLRTLCCYQMGLKRMGFRDTLTWVWISALPVNSCVIVGKNLIWLDYLFFKHFFKVILWETSNPYQATIHPSLSQPRSEACSWVPYVKEDPGTWVGELPPWIQLLYCYATILALQNISIIIESFVDSVNPDN